MIFNIIWKRIIDILYDIMKFTEVLYMEAKTEVPVVYNLTSTDEMRVLFHMSDDVLDLIIISQIELYIEQLKI